MRFTEAWAAVSAQNVTLKVAVLCLSVSTLCLTVSTIYLAGKAPILIDRECSSRAIRAGSSEHPNAEIEAFLREALPARFDSGASPRPGYLSVEEEMFRAQEQKEMATQNMTQKVIISAIKVDGSSVSIETDRLIAVGKLRSAFLFPLTVTLGTVDRTETNPYGLTIVRVSANQEGAKSDTNSK